MATAGGDKEVIPVHTHYTRVAVAATVELNDGGRARNGQQISVSAVHKDYGGHYQMG